MIKQSDAATATADGPLTVSLGSCTNFQYRLGGLHAVYSLSWGFFPDVGKEIYCHIEATAVFENLVSLSSYFFSS